MKHILFFAIVLAPLSAIAAAVTQQFSLAQQIEVSVTSVGAKVLDSNDNRNYLLIQNKGTGNVYLRIGSAATPFNSAVIAGNNGSYEFNVCPVGPVYLRAATGPESVAIIEGNAQ